MKTLVTGGSRGIGLACALRLAKEGHEVFIAARGQQGLETASAHAYGQGLSLTPIAIDVADAASVAAGFARLGSELDVLVHAAGVSANSDIAEAGDPGIWRQLLSVNLDGAYLCAREARARMSGGGRIIFVSSTLGLRGMRHSHAYCAAKHGVLGLMRALALDLIPEGITVNAICPGWVDTEMARADMAAMAERYGLEAREMEAAEIGAVPLNRWILPAEVAGLAAYLSSEASAAVTGQAIEISGGL